MRYSISGIGVERGDVPAEKVEEILRDSPRAEVFHVGTLLESTLRAIVVRDPVSKKETVRLSLGGKEVVLSRDSEGSPGDIGVSCRPSGLEVPVDSINVAFRDYNDEYTDRGVAWVHPGSPGTMDIYIWRRARDVPGMVTQIIAQAEEALRTKVLAHFSK